MDEKNTIDTITFDRNAIPPALALPDEHSLVEVLDGLYKHFAIDAYLDQLGAVDDRISAITDSLDEIIVSLQVLNRPNDKELIESLEFIRSMIDHSPE